MTVIMATVGFRADKVLPVLDQEDHKEELVLFHDKDSKDNQGRSKAAARELEGVARKLGVPCRLVEIDAFDLVRSCLEVRREIRRRKDRGVQDIVLSVAGGTRVLGSAALLASILEGVRVVHVSERDNAVQPLPLLKLDAGAVLNKEKRRLLEYVRDHPGCRAQEAARDLRLTKGTVSHHVQGLLRQGLVDARPDPEDSRSRLLHAVPSADLLLVG